MQKKAKTAVDTMLTRSHKDRLLEDCTLSVRRKVGKGQTNLVQDGAALGHQLFIGDMVWHENAAKASSLGEGEATWLVCEMCFGYFCLDLNSVSLVTSIGNP